MFIRDELVTEGDIGTLEAYPKEWVYGWVGSPGSTERYYNSTIVDHSAANRRTIVAPKALEDIAQKLKLEPRDRLIRCYFNKTVHGMQPAVHRDTPIQNGGDYSCVVYVVPEWDITWGGETVVYNTDGTASIAVVRRGRVVTFQSGLQHQAKATNSGCPVERVVATFKYARYSAVEDFILGCGWDSVPHKMHYTTTFAEHLLETAGLLRRFGASRHVIAAGALHAAYGTRYFSPPNPATRTQIRELIGGAGEQLVHEFCTLDRVQVKDSGSKELKMIAAANEYDLLSLERLASA